MSKAPNFSRGDIYFRLGGKLTRQRQTVSIGVKSNINFSQYQVVNSTINIGVDLIVQIVKIMRKNNVITKIIR